MNERHAHVAVATISMITEVGDLSMVSETLTRALLAVVGRPSRRQRLGPEEIHPGPTRSEAAAGSNAPGGRAAGAPEAEDLPKDCEDLDATLDLAELQVGRLSREGIRRLADHLKICDTCQIYVAMMMAEMTCVDATENQLMASIHRYATGDTDDPTRASPVADVEEQSA